MYQDPSVRAVIGFHSFNDGGTNEFSKSQLQQIYPEWRPIKNNKTAARYHSHKWFFKDQPKTFRYPWRWPFVDIFFIKESASGILINLDAPRMRFHHQYEDVFPLHRRPYMGMWLPSPRKTQRYLTKKIIRDSLC